ncbi:translation initiation factor IF-2-like [Cebus imitator]|uniref:translation initiation factor IF-2-like n=1 Tax=Cebus imitator TaxID=2715852 RepID=UPI001899386D|nr:translation initiation factor IF-2-like [Cebus imitator]
MVQYTQNDCRCLRALDAPINASCPGIRSFDDLTPPLLGLPRKAVTPRGFPLAGSPPGACQDTPADDAGPRYTAGAEEDQAGSPPRPHRARSLRAAFLGDPGASRNGGAAPGSPGERRRRSSHLSRRPEGARVLQLPSLPAPGRAAPGRGRGGRRRANEFTFFLSPALPPLRARRPLQPPPKRRTRPGRSFWGSAREREDGGGEGGGGRRAGPGEEARGAPGRGAASRTVTARRAGDAPGRVCPSPARTRVRVCVRECARERGEARRGEEPTMRFPRCGSRESPIAGRAGPGCDHL